MFIFLSFIVPVLSVADSVLIVPSTPQDQSHVHHNQQQTQQNRASNPTPNSFKPTNEEQLRVANHTNFAPHLDAKAGSGLQVYHTCSLSQSFGLTFDDGPTELSAKLDKTLEDSNLRATFFINGNNFGCIYDHAYLLRERFKKGHLIASHTWSHVHLTQGTYQQIYRQIELLEEAMIKILGVKPLYFRPPYGEYNEDVLKVLREKGYKGLILWSEDSQDSFGSPPSPSEIIRTYQSYPEKTIVLNHETHEFMVDEVVPSVIPKLKAKKFKLLPIASCLNLGSNSKDWYQHVRNPGSRDDSWTCDGTPAPGNFE